MRERHRKREGERCETDRQTDIYARDDMIVVGIIWTVNEDAWMHGVGVRDRHE